MNAVAHKTLAEALVEAQAAMPSVGKDAKNPHFNSEFTSLDHLIAETRPVLTKHGLAIKQAPTHIDGAPALETTIHHVSGERETDVMLLLVSKNDMQGLGSAITYGKRYMWASVLGVSSESDDDGNASTAQAEQAASPQVLSDDPGDYVVTFGKYKGTRLGDVHERDRGYVEWLSREGKQEVKDYATALCWLAADSQLPTTRSRSDVRLA